MTLDDAIQAATQMLEERGQLLNGHLLRLVEGDKELFQAVREQLIREGLGEDRAGVGLARIDKPEDSVKRALKEILPQLRSNPTDWWLMTAGAIRGPVDLIDLCEMRCRGEIKAADVVRHSAQGTWQRLDDIPELAASKPVTAEALKSFRIRDRQRAEWELYQSQWGGGDRAFSGKIKSHDRNADTNATLADRNNDSPPPQAADLSLNNSPGQSDVLIANIDEEGNTAVETNPSPLAIDSRRFVPPTKIWSLEDHRPAGWGQRSWNLLADLIGGSRRLKIMLAVAVTAGVLTYWWRQPPPASAIYAEFTDCRSAIMKLQDRRAKRSEWAPTVERYRPRVQRLIDRIRLQATDRNPVQRELYLAGSEGLLPLLENPMDPTKAERLFAQHIDSAKRLLDGNKPERSKNERPN